MLTAAGASLKLNVASDMLLYLSLTVAIARLGGMFSAFVAALWSSLLLNYYFIPPVHSITIAEANNAIALVVVRHRGLTVASVVDLAIKQTRSAAHASAEAETLNAFAVAVLRGDSAISALLERFRETFSWRPSACCSASSHGRRRGCPTRSTTRAAGPLVAVHRRRPRA